MKQTIQDHSTRYGTRLQNHIETALRAAFTRDEIEGLVAASGLDRVEFVETDDQHFMIQRTGESDPNSWIKVREQYR
jgi:hypothetical protein